MQRYNPKEIEPKWQQKWLADKTFQVHEDPSKPKKYIIDMFPYPSGAAMHVGHVRNFTISDVLSQFNRQKGHNVMHTMGWDTFGLPAENYAIKTGTPPAETTKANIANFKHQLQQLGMSYDWSREINTSDPSYYKWTQWIFTKLFENGLAYQKESPQWWCPFDKTVLANEQVEGGRCWRCGNQVVKKNLKQWFFKITTYADELLDDIEDLDWPEKIKTMQRNWIGRSKGAEVRFTIDGSEEEITVFTTRPDTIYGATFLVLAPEHPLVSKVTTPDQKAGVETYVQATQKKSEVERQENKEKTGVFTGAYVINPANNEKIPVWIADYVLMGYGTGAIMAVPAHDERDYEFAGKSGLPIVPVVSPYYGERNTEARERQTVAVVGHDPKTDKYCLLKWQRNPGVHGKSGMEWPGGGIEEGETAEQAARREFAEETGYTDITVNDVLPVRVSYYWSYQPDDGGPVRQRYSVKTVVTATVNSLKQEEAESKDDYEQDAEPVWMTKDEILSSNDIWPSDKLMADFVLNGGIHTGEGVMVNSGQYNGMPSAEAREKIVLDLAGKGVAEERVNYKIHDWLISRQRYWGAPIPIIHCPEHGPVPVQESDLPVVLPEVESFAPTGEGSVLATATDWVNTTCPICGKPAKRETDTMDGYACSSWYFLRYTDPDNSERAWDPAKANYWLPIDYYCGGDHAVSHLLYSRFWMHFFAGQGWIEQTRREPVGKLVYNGYILAHDGQKMSKSKGNVVNPDDLIEQGYGADSVRLFEMFIAPYDQNTSWNTNGVPGTFRFLQRVWVLAQQVIAASGEDKADTTELKRVINRAVKRVSDDLEVLSFNTAVAAMMEATNELYGLRDKISFAEAPQVWRGTMERLIQLLAPFAPHMTEELWHQFGHGTSVHFGTWPQYEEQYITSDTMALAVQVNGKVRGEITVDRSMPEADIIVMARDQERVRPYLEGKAVKKAIYVPGKLVSLVVA